MRSRGLVWKNLPLEKTKYRLQRPLAFIPIIKAVSWPLDAPAFTLKAAHISVQRNTFHRNLTLRCGSPDTEVRDKGRKTAGDKSSQSKRRL